MKICGFKNSIVYTFYIVYQLYRFLVKLYICGLTYRIYIRYRHKLRTDVIITYVSTRYRYYRSGPSTANIRTSGYPFYCSIGTAPVRSTSLCWWNLWDGIPGDPPLDLWDGIPPGISSRMVTAALGRPLKFHRKVPGRSQWDPSRIRR